MRSSDYLHEELAKVYRGFRFSEELREYTEVIWAEIEQAEAEEGVHG